MNNLQDIIKKYKEIMEKPYIPMTPEFRSQLINYIEETCPEFKGTGHEKVIDGLDEFLTRKEQSDSDS